MKGLSRVDTHSEPSRTPVALYIIYDLEVIINRFDINNPHFGRSAQLAPATNNGLICCLISTVSATPRKTLVSIDAVRQLKLRNKTLVDRVPRLG